MKQFLLVERTGAFEENRRLFEKRLSWFIAGFAVLVFLNSFFPRDWNWGIHTIAFFPFYIKILWLLAVFLLLYPPSRDKIFQSFLSFINILQHRLRRKTVLIPLILGLVICASFPVHFYLLGDGGLSLRSLKDAMSDGSEDVSILNSSYEGTDDPNEPLAGAINWVLFFALKLYKTGNAELLFRVLGGISFLVITACTYYFFKKMHCSIETKVLISGSLLVSAASLFFFGYVENYAMFFAMLIVYMLCSWLALESEIYFIVPAITFAILVTMHRGGLVFVPSFVLVLIAAYRKSKVESFVAALSSLATLLFLLLLLKVPLQDFLSPTTTGRRAHFLPLFSVSTPGFSYPVFSFMHFIDLLNEHLFEAPFAFVIIVLFFLTFRGHIKWKQPLFLFLLVTVGCGLLFTIVISFDLGIARDWDIASIMLVPLIILSVFLLLEISMEKSPVMVFMLGVLLLQCTLWVALNANEQRSMERFYTLESETIMSKPSRAQYYDELASYFREKNDFEKVAFYLEKYIATVTPHSRILDGLADAYGKLGKNDKLFEIYKWQARIDSTNAEVWLNLGSAYFHYDSLKSAKTSLERCLAIDSENVEGLYLYASVLFNMTENCSNSAYYFRKALAIEPTHIKSLRQMTVMYGCLKEVDSAIAMGNIYLQYVPNDSSIVSFIDLLKNDRK